MDDRKLEQRESAESMHRYVVALLSATSFKEVAAAVAECLPAVLGADSAGLIGPDNSGEHHTGDDESAPRLIPLRSGSRALGTLVVEECSGSGDPAGESVAAEFLATTLARIRSTDRLHTQAVKEAAELRFDVVSMLSHEMRTPLTSIKGYATALLMDETSWDPASTTEFLQSIEAEADHLTKLVADILEATAIEAGDLRLDLEPILMSRIAKRVVDKVAIRGAGHRFVLMFPPDFPIVEADAHRVEQVLTNLLDNAVKYSPDGGMVLVRGEVADREVTVSVVDQGMGIAPEHLNKLFERFFRAVPDHRKRIVGTGLGLPIADAIVRAHGGRIWASSVVGGGTTLSFTLPHPRVAGVQVT